MIRIPWLGGEDVVGWKQVAIWNVFRFVPRVASITRQRWDSERMVPMIRTGGSNHWFLLYWQSAAARELTGRTCSCSRDDGFCEQARCAANASQMRACVDNPRRVLTSVGPIRITRSHGPCRSRKCAHRWIL